MSSAVCTIIAKNYLPFARVLMGSVARWAPELRRIVILVDRIDGCFDPAGEDFDLILSEDLGLPDSKWFHFKYTLLELSTAVKPFVLQFLSQRYDFEKLVYLDPDIKVYGPLAPLLQMLDQDPIVLTPHLTDPLDDGLRPSELDILQSGTYNLGFIGLSSAPETSRFLAWWQAKLQDHCVVDPARGLFVDQRWIDLAPGLFAGVRIVREPGYNVAYWNLKHRRVERTGDGYTVNGRPLYFFHFSGFDPDHPVGFSKYQNRFDLPDLGDAQHLIREYRQDLLAQGYAECRSWPYAYATFANGLPIPDVGRPLHHESPDIVARIEDPFSEEGCQAFLRVWNQPVAADRGECAGITRLAYRIYRTRSDVQAAMPDVFGGDWIRFLEWVVSSAKGEHALDEVFLVPAREALQAASGRQEAGGQHAEDQHLAAGAASAHALDGLAGNGSEGVQLTRLARTIYESRPDLQQYFPAPCGRDRVKYLAWLLTYGRMEYGLHESFLAPLRDQWDALVGSLPAVRARARHRGILLGMRGSVRVRGALRGAVARLQLARARRAARRFYGAASTASASPAPASSAPLAGRDSELGLNLVGYLRSEMGVGESARLAAMAARRAALPLALKSVDDPGPHRQADARAGPPADVFPYRFNLFHVNADQTPVVHGVLGGSFCAGRYNIGYWAWELEEFPDRWLPFFEFYQEIWTPSAFCQDAISRKSPIPVLRVPHAIEVDVPRSMSRADFGLPSGGFVFLTIFDMLSVFERKNPLAVVEAFVRAFGNSSACHLVVKINHGHLRPDQVQRLRAAGAGYPVTILDHAAPREEVNALVLCCDCLVSLHRSEGFGLTLAEAMCLGKPVIATAYSGNLDFTRSDNAFLVGYRLQPVGKGCEPYDEGLMWAEPSIEAAAAQMKAVHECQDLRQRRAMVGQEFVREFFSPAAVGRQMRNRLEAVRSRIAADAGPATPAPPASSER